VSGAVILESMVTCPRCGTAKTEIMPTDACQFFYDCTGCWRSPAPRAWRLLCVLLLRFHTLSADSIDTMLRRVNFEPLSRSPSGKVQEFRTAMSVLLEQSVSFRRNRVQMFAVRPTEPISTGSRRRSTGFRRALAGSACHLPDLSSASNRMEAWLDENYGAVGR